MKMTGMESDREKVPLMKDLHELGLKHGVTLVVVAVQMNAAPGAELRPMLIDHKDNTPVQDLVSKFTGAGVFLIQCAAAAEEYAYEQAERAKREASATAHQCEEECRLPKP